MAGRPRGGIGLEYLSVFGMALPDHVALAARLGFDFVSVNWRGAANAAPGQVPASLRDSPSARRELAAALADRGLRLELVEGFAIAPEGSVADHAAALDAIAGLGARSVCIVSLDRDIGRTEAEFARFAELAASRGLIATTEVGAGVMWDIGVASAAWRAVAHPAFALLIDAMHFFRRGGTPADLGALPPEAIGHVQLCDVPMPAVIADYMDEALHDRRCPGDGDLPLQAFLATVPVAVPIGLEVPIGSARYDLEPSLSRCLSRTRDLVRLRGLEGGGRPDLP